ncbi:hypothetical protein HanRHA438_Chr14g0647761 [Helianthus annuus]|nr:hypothetical protein HanRHA438_Chr14g0647761 [Helianthus annuus]
MVQCYKIRASRVNKHTKPKASTRLLRFSSVDTPTSIFSKFTLCSSFKCFSSPRATISISGCTNLEERKLIINKENKSPITCY